MGNEEKKEDFVIRVPSEWIVKVVESAGIDGLRNLQSPWAVIIQEESGIVSTSGFEDQPSCSAMVASIHGTDAEAVFVLKNGIPRKNIRIEVTARFR
jgi:hypothetical protein